MQQRRETIEQGVKLGEQMQKDKAALEAKVEKSLHEARQQADDIIAAAQDTARQTIREAEEKARDKADGIVASAEDRINQEAARARRQLEQEVVSLVAEATEVIIDEKVDAKKDAQLMERALKESRAG